VNDQTLIRSRSGSEAVAPAVKPDVVEHQDWLIDVANDLTFPASDAPSAVQPGSLAGRAQTRKPAPSRASKRRPSAAR